MTIGGPDVSVSLVSQFDSDLSGVRSTDSGAATAPGPTRPARRPPRPPSTAVSGGDLLAGVFAAVRTLMCPDISETTAPVRPVFDLAVTDCR